MIFIERIVRNYAFTVQNLLQSLKFRTLNTQCLKRVSVLRLLRNKISATEIRNEKQNRSARYSAGER